MKLIIDKPFGLLLIFSGLLGIELFIIYLLAGGRRDTPEL
jgi:hypothetical protein